MSLNAQHGGERQEIQWFHGDKMKFPIFRTRMQGIIRGLGKDYHKAIRNLKPFEDMKYDPDFLSDDDDDDDAYEPVQHVEGKQEPVQAVQDIQALPKPVKPDFKAYVIDLDQVDFSNPEAIQKAFKKMQEFSLQVASQAEEYAQVSAQYYEKNALMPVEAPRAKEREAAVHRPKKLQDRKVQSRYNTVCHRVWSLLMQYLGTEPIRKIENYGVTDGDGIKAWKVINQVYQAGSKENRRALMSRLSDIKMEGRLSKLNRPPGGRAGYKYFSRF